MLNLIHTHTHIYNFLRLNDNKTEVLLTGSKHMLQMISDFGLHIGNDRISLIERDRKICAMFNNTFSMNTFIAHICMGAWYHLRGHQQN